MSALALDYNAIRRSIALTVEQTMGYPCLLEEQKGQSNVTALRRPELPYFAFKITTPGARTGDDSHTFSGTPGVYNVAGQRVMSVSFHCYAKDQETAYSLMSTWQASLDLKNLQASLQSLVGISVLSIGSVADLSQLLNTGYEGRAQLDVKFGLASNLSENLGTVASVPLAGQVDSVSENFTVT